MRLTLLCSLLVISCTMSCKGQPTTSNPLNGEWFIEVKTEDIGLVRTVMTFTVSDTSLHAQSPANADRKILGYGKSILGRTFNKSFENGSLLHIRKGSIKDSSGYAIFKAVLTSAAGNYYIFGTAKGGKLNCLLKDGAYTAVGSLTGTKDMPKLPLEDYAAIAAKALGVTEEHIYNPALLKTKDWQNFRKAMTEFAPKSEDDVEMVFAHFYYASKLPFSHYSLLRKNEPDKKQDIGSTSNMTLTDKPGGIAYLDINSFSGEPGEADSFMKVICDQGYKHLIIDLRDNSGGNIAPAMKMASYLVDKPYYGGILLTQKWFKDHPHPPAVDDYPSFTQFSAANYDLLIEGVHREKGIVLKVGPGPQRFKGNVYILTNENTASTCEPFVYALQQYKIAKIVGTTTAGAMLTGEFFDLGNHYRLFLPTADYYTADGYRIDKQGVKPDVESDKPLEYILGQLK